MEYSDLIKNRYSVRQFSDKAVSEDDIVKILEAGMVAPTAANKQPQRIFVLQLPEALEKIRSLTKMVFNAPVVIMVCYDAEQSLKLTQFGDDHDSGEVDAAIVTTHMMLEAENLGLGSLWARGFKAETIEKAFNFPENLKLVCLLDIGYPAENAKPSPMHSDRLPLEETVVFM